MARTVNEIRTQITGIYVSNMADIGIAVDPTVWSALNLVRLLIYVFAFCSYTLEVLFDNHSADTDERLRELKPPSKRWYVNIIKKFQYGFPLIPGTDLFDNTGYTTVQIEASKVIKHVAVIKQVNVYGRVKLRLKIAGSNGTDLVQIDPNVVTALTAYLEDDAAAAGDNWEVEGKNYDKLKMSWRIYYDPLILNGQGQRLDGTDNEPVKTAIKSFLKDGIKFSGTYVVVYHQDWVQKVPGVVIPEIITCQGNYGNLSFVSIATEYDPDAGWIRFESDTDLQIEYIKRNAI